MPPAVVPESEVRKTSLKIPVPGPLAILTWVFFFFCDFLGGPTFEVYIAHPYPINVDVESKRMHRANP